MEVFAVRVLFFHILYLVSLLSAFKMYSVDMFGWCFCVLSGVEGEEGLSEAEELDG